MYDLFYKLYGKPFQLSPDPKFFYGSSGHRRALAYLKYGLEQGEGFIVITGDVGAGKTTLVRTLLDEVSKKNVIAAQLVSTQLDAEDVLRRIASAFNVQSEGISKAQLLRNIEVYLKYQMTEGRRVLLVIDEAQNLPHRTLEELRMLSNFQVGDKPLLQSFLVGQPEFRVTIEAPENEQFKQRVIASYHLGPMDVSEIKGYVEHRLKCVGWTGDPVLEDGAYETIYSFTRGIPRKINVLCDRLMLYGSLEGLHSFDLHTVTAVQKEMQGTTASLVRDETNEAGDSEYLSRNSVDLARYDSLELLERRVIGLEQQILNLEKSFRRECAMLRKVVLHYVEARSGAKEQTEDKGTREE